MAENSTKVCWEASVTYHKFVKTTPNPRATKKSKGELVGPLLELLFVGEGLGMDEGGEDMVASHCPCICLNDERGGQKLSYRVSEDCISSMYSGRGFCTEGLAIMNRERSWWDIG